MKVYCEFLRLYFAPETNNLSVSLKKIPIQTFERILDLKHFIDGASAPEKKKESDEDQKRHLKEIIDKVKDDLQSAPSGLLQFSDIQSKNTKFSFKNLSFLKNSLKNQPESRLGWFDDYLGNEGNQKGPLTTTNIQINSSAIDMNNYLEAHVESAGKDKKTIKQSLHPMRFLEKPQI